LIPVAAWRFLILPRSYLQREILEVIERCNWQLMNGLLPMLNPL